MNRTQILAMGLTSLKEFGLIEVTKADPEKNVIGTLKLWEMALSDLSDSELHAGFNGLLANWTDEFKRKPMPGDLRKFVKKHTSLNHGEMWAEITANGYKARHGEFNRLTGAIERHQWSNPLIPKAMAQMGGLDVFLNIKTDQEQTLRAQFRDIVNSLNEKEANKAIVRPLIELQLAEAQGKQEGVIQIAEARDRKQAQEPMRDASPIIEGIKAKFNKAQIEKQQLSREAKKAQLDAYIAEHGIEVQTLIDSEFWQTGQQELADLEDKIESMSQAMKGFKVV